MPELFGLGEVSVSVLGARPGFGRAAPALPGVRLLSPGSRSCADLSRSPVKRCPARPRSISVTLQLKIGGHLTIR